MPLTKLPSPSEDLALQLAAANEKYNYYKELTTELDRLPDSDVPLAQEDLFRIVLWKLNRYPRIPHELLMAMDDLRLAPTPEKGEAILRRLLNKEECTGFDLPMASTVLRFLAPDHFAIIDQRVYRLIMPPGEDRLMLAGKSVEKKVTLYFSYLDRLRWLAEAHGIAFHLADRIFYEYDKDVNKALPIHRSPSDAA